MQIAMVIPSNPSPGNLRFAAKKAWSPTNWRYELTAGDFDSSQQLRLKSSVIQKMATALIREDLTQPGFVFIPNIHEFAPTLEDAWQFQKSLVQDIYTQTEKTWGVDTVEYATGDVVIVDRDEAGVVGRRGGKGVDSFHFDGGIDQLVSFLYRTVNLKGGLPMVGDIIRYLTDQGNLPGLDELSNSDPRYVMRAETLTGEAPQKPSFFQRMLGVKQASHPMERYQVTINDPVFDLPNGYPIVVVNNRRGDGVTHTGSDLRKIDPEQPCARVLRQVFIRTDMIPDQRIVLVGPPPNDLEKSLLPVAIRNRFDGMSQHSREHRLEDLK